MGRGSRLEVPPGVPVVRHSVVKVADHRAFDCEDHLAVEEPLEIRLARHEPRRDDADSR